MEKLRGKVAARDVEKQRLEATSAELRRSLQLCAEQKEELVLQGRTQLQTRWAGGGLAAPVMPPWPWSPHLLWVRLLPSLIWGLGHPTRGKRLPGLPTPRQPLQPPARALWASPPQAQRAGPPACEHPLLGQACQPRNRHSVPAVPSGPASGQRSWAWRGLQAVACPPGPGRRPCLALR